MIICYMAGPIDYEEDKGASWKEELLSLCDTNKNLGFFDPCAPFKFQTVDTDVSNYIHNINMVALNQADVLIGSLKKGQTSVGTPIEFYHSFNNSKPMIIITDMAASVYMKYMEQQRTTFVKNVSELYSKLMKLANEIEEQRAQMRCARATLGEVQKFRTEESLHKGQLVGAING